MLAETATSCQEQRLRVAPQLLSSSLRSSGTLVSWSCRAKEDHVFEPVPKTQAIAGTACSQKTTRSWHEARRVSGASLPSLSSFGFFHLGLLTLLIYFFRRMGEEEACCNELFATPCFHWAQPFATSWTQAVMCECLAQ